MKVNETNIAAARAAFERALAACDRLGAQAALHSAQEACGLTRVLEDVVTPALESMGRAWETGALALSQIYMGGRICEELMDALLPPASPQRKSQPKMAIAVLEDYHFLGKRMVYAHLRACGFELRDYGRMDADGLIARVAQDQVEVLWLSTLMLPSALKVREVRGGLRALRRPVKLVVGGAPFRLDPELWHEVGADATSPSASGAVAVLTQLFGGKP